jgi:hypothetical protein
MTIFHPKSRRQSVGFLFIALVAGIATCLPAARSYAAADWVFPVIGDSSYSNDYNSPRDGGPHHAIDIIAGKRQKIVSATDGVVQYVFSPQPSWGYSVVIKSPSYCYWYIHINNDTPGTDNGHGGEMNAYAPYMKAGNSVVKGQFVGYVGDSGNAETTVSHLHFEVLRPDSNGRCNSTNGTHLNPYTYLNKAARIAKPRGYPPYPNEVLPFQGKANTVPNIAVGNVDDNLTDQEIVTAGGAKGPPKVKIYKQDRTLVKEFYAYNTAFKGGVDVALADVDNDGQDEIITAAGKGGGPHVKILRSDGTLYGQFMAYSTSMTKGLRVAAGDIQGDTKPEIVVGPLSGTSPLRVYSLAGALQKEFSPYGSFPGGFDVAIGPVYGSDSTNEIITGAGRGGGPHVKVFDANGTTLDGFYAYRSSFRGGVRVAVGDVSSSNSGDEIVTAPMTGGGPHIYAYTPDGTRLNEYSYLEDWWRGDYDVAAGSDVVYGATGLNRRSSIMKINSPIYR